MKNRIINYVRVPKTGSLLLSTYLFGKTNYIVRGLYHLPYVIMSKQSPPNKWITTARDPLQMYSSFYHFMYKRVHSDFFQTNPLSYTHHNECNIELLKNKVSLEEFLIECPKGQFLPYFWLPMLPKDFDFIGITENMVESLQTFNKMFNLNIPNEYKNYNNDKSTKEPYNVNSDVEKKFKKLNFKEYELYNLAKIKFQEQSKKWLA